MALATGVVVENAQLSAEVRKHIHELEDRAQALRTLADLSTMVLESVDARAVAEMALASKVGVTLNATSHPHAHLYLFGEDQGRYLIATHDPGPILGAAKAAGVHAIVAGAVGGDAFGSKELFSIPLEKLRKANEAWMPAYMGD